MRGSRFAGLLSIRNTTVRGSLCAEWQPASATSAARASTLRIRHLAQNSGPCCARGRGYVAEPVMPGLPRQQRKGRGLLGFNGKAEVLARGQFATKRLQPLRQHGHQCVVACSAAGNDIVHSALHLRLDEPLVALRNGLRGQRGGSGQGVLGLVAVPPARRKKLCCILAAKMLAVLSARRGLPKKNSCVGPPSRH